MARYVPKEGYVTKWRRYQNHRFHFTQENRAPTCGEAWEDLLFMAAFKPHDRWYKGKEYHLNVGEIVTSLHDLAARWQWSRGKVRRFLDDLEVHGEADHRTDQVNGPLATIITIHGLNSCPKPNLEGGPPRRTTKRTPIEEVDLEVQGLCTSLSSNPVQELVQGVVDNMGTTKKKG